MATHVRVGLVLGGGGAGGWMFHAGVVRTLERRFGWDAAGAAITIGTSAGASVAAGLRLGCSVDEIVAELDRPPSDAEMRQFREIMDAKPWQWKPLQPGLLKELLPGRKGAGVALSGLLPPGRYPTWPLARIGGGLENGQWPERLWITATRAADGSLVVFGRDAPAAALGEAIEASCALPGVMEPKLIEGVHYVDGGALSPTHADLAADAAVDITIVSSPMTRPGRRPLGILARRRLTEEVDELTQRGIIAVVAEPPDGTDAMFRDYPRRDRAVGADIRLMGEAAAEVAMVAAGLGPGDLGT